MPLGSLFFSLLLVGLLCPLAASQNGLELPLTCIPALTLQGLEGEKQALLCQLLAGKPDPLHPTPSYCSPSPPAGKNKAHFPFATTRDDLKAS